MSMKAAQDTHCANLNLCFSAKFYCFGYKDDSSYVELDELNHLNKNIRSRMNYAVVYFAMTS